jgi:PAS domain
MTDPKFPWALAANIGIGRKNERRLTGRALLYWWTLKGDAAFPRHSALPLDSQEVKKGEGLWPNIFTVSLPQNPDDSSFVYCGSALAEVSGIDCTGRRAAQCLPSPLWDKFRYVFEAAKESMKPLTASGRFEASGGRIALYRAIVLPLSEDGNAIDHLLGAISFKFDGR